MLNSRKTYRSGTSLADLAMETITLNECPKHSCQIKKYKNVKLLSIYRMLLMCFNNLKLHFSFDFRIVGCLFNRASEGSTTWEKNYEGKMV